MKHSFVNNYILACFIAIKKLHIKDLNDVVIKKMEEYGLNLKKFCYDVDDGIEIFLKDTMNIRSKEFISEKDLLFCQFLKQYYPKKQIKLEIHKI